MYAKSESENFVAAELNDAVLDGKVQTNGTILLKLAKWKFELKHSGVIERLRERERT